MSLNLDGSSLEDFGQNGAGTILHGNDVQIAMLYSIAVSAKRQADSMEKIVSALEKQSRRERNAEDHSGV